MADVPTLRQLQTVIEALQTIDRRVSYGQLASDIAASSPQVAYCTAPCIEFLQKLKLISIRAGDQISLQLLRPEATKRDAIHKLLADALITYLVDTEILKEFSLHTQRIESTNKLVLDSASLGWNIRGYRNLLLNLKIFQREKIDQRHWEIAENFIRYFEAASRNSNLREFHTPGVTPDEIGHQNARKEVLGGIAEEWVLNRERATLADHPFLDLVTRISTINASAGYDILSFSSINATRHDRFLEVKSFDKKPHFYWSDNEISKAKDLGNSYHLALVDRTKLMSNDYTPKIIRGPYRYFFECIREDWQMEPNGYHFIQNAG